jgi:hypothetical protein
VHATCLQLDAQSPAQCAGESLGKRCPSLGVQLSHATDVAREMALGHELGDDRRDESRTVHI